MNIFSEMTSMASSSGLVVLERGYVIFQELIKEYSAIQIGVISVLGLFTLCFLIVLYMLCIVPLNRVRGQHDVGYIPGVGEEKLSRKQLANQVLKRRRVGDVPPVFPNGWYCLLESRNLAVGEVKSANYLGLSLTVFRDESKQVHAVDAHCPHMGANFSAGGRVFGDCIECPFHGWRFSGYDGKCKHIPYAEKIPDVARVKSWPVLERNRHVYIWYHAEGVEPYWFPPHLDEIENGTWPYRGRTEHFINAHIEEIPENGADLAHLRQVHEKTVLAGVDLRHMFSKLWDFTHHEWHDVTWTPQEKPNSHTAVMNLTHVFEIFGFRPIALMDLKVKAWQIGPSIVYLKFENLFGKGVFMQHLTPTESLMQHMRHHIYTTLPNIVAKTMLVAEAYQVERDIMIWNNKQYAGKPVFVRSKEDELISKHRRWYSQFYSENSPKLKLNKDTLEW